MKAGRSGRIATMLLVLGSGISLLGIYLTQQGAPESPDPLHREFIEKRFELLGYPIVAFGALLIFVGVAAIGRFKKNGLKNPHAVGPDGVARPSGNSAPKNSENPGIGA